MQENISPYKLFKSWHDEACVADIDPAPAVLSTVNHELKPSSRIILIREFDQQGFVFYTNKESRKGREFFDSSYAALCFHWQALHRQIRIEGAIEEVSKEAADSYFASRPIGHQVNALISKQSSILDSYEEFVERHTVIEKQLANQLIARPDYWTGFRLKPSYFEFWQEGPNRCHLRQAFTLQDNNVWAESLLYP